MPLLAVILVTPTESERHRIRSERHEIPRLYTALNSSLLIATIFVQCSHAWLVINRERIVTYLFKEPPLIDASIRTWDFHRYFKTSD